MFLISIQECLRLPSKFTNNDFYTFYNFKEGEAVR